MHRPAPMWNVVDPPGNPYAFARVESPLFSQHECEQVIGAAPPTPWTDSLTYGRSVDEQEVGSRRRTQQRLLVADGADWPLPAITDFIERANAEYHRYELTGSVRHDPPHVLRYRAADQGLFDRHIDSSRDAGSSTRKLSYVVQLSPSDAYEGCNLVFGDEPDDDAVAARRQQGTIVVFPSWMSHEVTLCTRGERVCIVGWLHGPPIS